MNFPINFTFGKTVIPSHLVFEILAFLVGFQYYSHLCANQEDHISKENRIWILVGATLGALLGSRLLASLMEPDKFLNPPHILYYYMNKTIVGGLLGGLIGVECSKKIIGERRSSGDLLTYPLIVGMIIGRVGCFLTGVADRTVGIKTALPWGMDLGDGIYRHPTALYEIVFLLLLWRVLKTNHSKVKFREGDLFKLFLSSYLTFRFFVDFIKPYPEIFWSLNSIQIACVLGLLNYIYDYTIMRTIWTQDFFTPRTSKL